MKYIIQFLLLTSTTLSFQSCEEHSETTGVERRCIEQVDCISKNGLLVKNVKGCGNFILYGEIQKNLFLYILGDKNKILKDTIHNYEFSINTMDTSIFRIYAVKYISSNENLVEDLCSDLKISLKSEQRKKQSPAVDGRLFIRFGPVISTGEYSISVKLINVIFRDKGIISVHKEILFDRIKVGLNAG